MAARKNRPVLWEVMRRGTEGPRRRESGAAPATAPPRPIEPAAPRERPAPRNGVLRPRIAATESSLPPLLSRIGLGNLELRGIQSWHALVAAGAALLILIVVIVQIVRTVGGATTPSNNPVFDGLSGLAPEVARNDRGDSPAGGSPAGASSGDPDRASSGGERLVAVPPKKNTVQRPEPQPESEAKQSPPESARQEAARQDSAEPDVVPLRPEKGKSYLIIQYFPQSKHEAARAARDFLNGNGVPCYLARGAKNELILIARDTFDLHASDVAHRRSEEKRGNDLRATVRRLGKQYARTHDYAFEQCFLDRLRP